MKKNLKKKTPKKASQKLPTQKKWANMKNMMVTTAMRKRKKTSSEMSFLTTKGSKMRGMAAPVTMTTTKPQAYDSRFNQNAYCSCRSDGIGENRTGYRVGQEVKNRDHFG